MQEEVAVNNFSLDSRPGSACHTWSEKIVTVRSSDIHC